jgi:hypothetical protein
MNDNIDKILITLMSKSTGEGYVAKDDGPAIKEAQIQIETEVKKRAMKPLDKLLSLIDIDDGCIDTHWLIGQIEALQKEQ